MGLAIGSGGGPLSGAASAGRSAVPKLYTTQRDAHGNMIVCRGEVARNAYAIIYTGSYDDCYMVKLGIVKPDRDPDDHRPHGTNDTTPDAY